MVMLQPKLHLKVSQRQILTPGLVQMVSVLALNKLELRDMITAEMVENPVLEELEDSVPLIDEVGQREEERDRPAPEENTITAVEKKNPFEEIDFGSFFQEYLDPGYRSPGEMEEIERPSFENFLSKPSNLSDHLKWQLGSIPVTNEVREAAEVIIGNLSEDGYLIASDEELLGIAPRRPETDASLVEKVVKEAAALGLDAALEDAVPEESFEAEPSYGAEQWGTGDVASLVQISPVATAAPTEVVAPVAPPVINSNGHAAPVFQVNFNLADLHEALEVVRQIDPPGVACRDLRECLLQQLKYHQQQYKATQNGNGESTDVLLADTIAVVDQHLRALQNKQYKEIARAMARPIEAVASGSRVYTYPRPPPRIALQQRPAPPDRARRSLRKTRRRMARNHE